MGTAADEAQFGKYLALAASGVDQQSVRIVLLGFP